MKQGGVVAITLLSIAAAAVFLPGAKGIAQTNPVEIFSIDPASGYAGTLVTITGTGFSENKNSLNLGDNLSPVDGVSSADGKTLQFAFPATYGSCKDAKGANCPSYFTLKPGVIQLTIWNGSSRSNSLPFHYLGLPSDTLKPVISELSPNSGPPGTTVTIKGSGFTPDNNSVTFGQFGAGWNLDSDGKTLKFKIPLNYGVTCSNCKDNVPPGPYPVMVYNGVSANSNQVTFTITKPSILSGINIFIAAGSIILLVIIVMVYRASRKRVVIG